MPAKHWAIGVVLFVQLAVLAAIPFRAIRTRATGAEITLWTAPVDPFDVMSGYYVTLTYEVETPAEDSDVMTASNDSEVWVIVRRDDPAWTQARITRDRPPITPAELSIRATWNGRRAVIANAGRLYIPETERDRAQQLLDDAKGRGLVDLKVDEDGNASVLRLRLGNVTFGLPR